MKTSPTTFVVSLGISLLLALPLSNCIDSKPSLDDIELGMEGGEASDSFAATGMLLADGHPDCTGSLVTPNKVLTAGHCARNQYGQTPQMEFIIGHDNDSAPIRRNVSSVAIHPDFTGQGQFYTSEPDVAVLTLEKPITSVKPMVLNFDSAEGLVGTSMLLVGYGRAANEQGMGIRRKATVTIAEVLQYKLRYDFAGASACNGDSGGPAFVLFDGVYRQVGVTSGGDANCQGVGYYTRVDAVADFLRQQGLDMQERSRQCEQDSNCDGICENDPDCASIMDGSFVDDPCAQDGQCNSDCDSDPDCTQPDPCAQDGQCNSDCDSDPDCTQPDPCAQDGQCNSDCDSDPDCTQPDPCAQDGQCNSDCDSDPDCTQPDLCAQDGQCNSDCDSDPDCTQPDPCAQDNWCNFQCGPYDQDCVDQAPQCYYVYRTTENYMCLYWDWGTDELCGQYPMQCGPWGCTCPW